MSAVRQPSRARSAAKVFVSGSGTISPVILRLAREDSTTLSITELEVAVATDPEFTIRTLALANSAFYSQQHEIDSLRTSLVVLGADTVHKLALTLLARSLHTPSSEVSESLWQHCQAVGVAAQMVAEVDLGVNPRSAFAAGLLHDIGLLAIDALSTEESVPVEEHAALGAEIAYQLGLSPSLSKAISLHDDNTTTDQAEMALVNTIRAANEIALRCGYTHCSESEANEMYLTSSLSRLGMEEVDLEALVEALPVRMQLQLHGAGLR